MNRRSFLGLLAGAVLAKPVSNSGVAALKPAILQPSNTQDWWMPFMISDWANLQPGEIADAVLFGGEQPEEFLLKAIGVRIASSAMVKDAQVVLGGETSVKDDEYVSTGAWMELKSGSLMLMESPLWYLPGIDTHPLPVPMMFRSVQPFSARIRSGAPLPLSKPTMVLMAIQGAVRMTPEQVAYMQSKWEEEENDGLN